MFNFFDEIKDIKNISIVEKYNLVNISGQLLYVEGHLGLTNLSKENISFRVKGGRIVVEGENMTLAELSENTIKIIGNIKKVEAF
jgi:sporulation protein YqfC